MVQDCNMVLQPHDNRMTAHKGGIFRNYLWKGAIILMLAALQCLWLFHTGISYHLGR